MRHYGRSWWETKRVKSTIPDLELIDSLVKLRGFDELFYDYLIKDITSLLCKIDNMAVELFMVKLESNKTWLQIWGSYPDMTYYTFYSYVQDIKNVVKKEVTQLV